MRKMCSVAFVALILFLGSAVASEITYTDQTTSVERHGHKARRYKLGGLGPGFIFGTDAVAYTFSGGLMWDAAPHAAVRTGGHFGFDQNVEDFFWDYTLGGCYFVSSSGVSPYFGAGLGVASTTEQFGFTVVPTAGITFFRNSNVTLLAEVSYIPVFAEGIPGAVLFQIAVGFAPDVVVTSI